MSKLTTEQFIYLMGRPQEKDGFVNFLPSECYEFLQLVKHLQAEIEELKLEKLINKNYYDAEINGLKYGYKTQEIQCPVCRNLRFITSGTDQLYKEKLIIELCDKCRDEVWNICEPKKNTMYNRNYGCKILEPGDIDQQYLEGHWKDPNDIKKSEDK